MNSNRADQYKDKFSKEDAFETYFLISYPENKVPAV